MKRLVVVGAVALTLGACDFGLVMTPDPADAGDQVTVTNAPDGPTCIVPDAQEQTAQAAAGVPVGVVVVTDFTDLVDGPDVTVVQSDDEGFFTATVTAPDIPGQHMVFAICDFDEEIPDPERLQAAAEPVDEDGVILDMLEVTQAPLSIDLSDQSVEPGDEVTATFNRCQDENDFDQFEEVGAGAAAEPTPEELATDYPDLQVFLDGELIETVLGEERYPTGTVDVPVTLDEVGEHEIKGVCTYQTFDLDLEAVIEEIGDGGPPILLEGGASAAAIDYPFDPEGGGLIVWDEATTEAADVVVVTDAGVGGSGAAPVPAQPSFTG